MSLWRTQDGGRCQLSPGWKHLRHCLVLSDGAAGAWGRMWGVISAGNTPCPCQTPPAPPRQLQEGQAFGQEQRGALLWLPVPAEHPGSWLPAQPAHLLAWHAARSQVVRQFHGCQKNLDLNRWPGYAAESISSPWLLAEQGLSVLTEPWAGSGLALPLRAAPPKPCPASGTASVP